MYEVAFTICIQIGIYYYYSYFMHRDLRYNKFIAMLKFTYMFISQFILNLPSCYKMNPRI